MKILAINPGSTSTKVALFEDESQLWSDTQRYDVEVIKQFSSIPDQEEFRLVEIKKALAAHHTDLTSLDAVVGRGGLLKPIPSGTYIVSEPMLEDLRSCRYGSHASNLGAPLAFRLAQQGSCNRSYIVDPVIVDEMIPEARLSGLPEIKRRSGRSKKSKFVRSNSLLFKYPNHCPSHFTCRAYNCYPHYYYSSFA